MSFYKEYKVWNTQHNVQKEVKAESLEDLLIKAKAEFGIDSTTEVKLVLDEDGTEVDDEDYFQFVSSDTTLQILLSFQSWSPIHLLRASYDVSDGPPALPNDLLLLLSGIKFDLAKCLALSDNHLEEITKIPVSDLATILVDSEQFARNFKEACEMELITREDNDDLLQLIRMAAEHQNGSVKRQKIDNTESDD
ncbi:DNA fragmentation factor subunit alpha-like [Octopus vulgaris]|uniref:DNAation factor subunit alpha-like n=1 Tax=Octopus vulgaris TaxID=6645 RepID=A0AA36F367_OCTVU|nr:DNA fragmentation factor subunit alpha-like [Octopus vulgaris]